MIVQEYLEKDQIERIYLLIICDIQSNTNRIKFAKMLGGFGHRVQKSAFETYLSPKKYEKLLKLIPKNIDPATDSVRIYRLKGNGKIFLFGDNNVRIKPQDAIII